MSALRDVLAFLIGTTGVMSDFYGVLAARGGHVQSGVLLVLAGLVALWAAFRVGSRG